jgi:GNAT superfamily N-acetyltransferase
VSHEIAEIKRMYVRPEARGLGIGRALMEGMIDDARALSYRALRLESAAFMREAHASSRSISFRSHAARARRRAALLLPSY